MAEAVRPVGSSDVPLATVATVSETEDAPAAVQPQASGGAKYFSPVVRLDPETQRVVLLYRDPETGDVLSQYPSEKQLKAYGESQKLAAGSKENA